MSNKIATSLRDATGVKRNNIYRIETDKLEVESGHNPRDYELPENRAHLDRLKASIRKHGVETPIKVRLSGGKILIVDGECRWRSCMEILAEEPANELAATIPATDEPGDEIERLRIALTANDGKPLSEWELGNGYKRFIKLGKDTAWIADECCVEEKNVKLCIELANAPLGVKQMLSELSVTSAAAVHAVRTHGDNATFVLKAKVEEAKEKAAAKPTKKKGSTPAKPAPVKRERASNGIYVPKKSLETILALFKSIAEITLQAPETYEMCETGSKVLEKLLVKEGV